MYGLEDSISDLLQQPIRGTSVNAMLHCPFHQDRTPSFSIHLEEGVWHCFSCSRSGTLKSLFRELGEEVGLDVRLYQAARDAESPVVASKNFVSLANRYLREAKSKRGRKLLDGFRMARGITTDTTRCFGIGYNPENDALCFPYLDEEERVTGIKYRHPDGFKSSESGSIYGLYGLRELLGKQEVIICEGESDTLSVHSRYGQRYGVGGTSGASVSEAQWNRFSLSLMFARRVYVLYDADDAGDKCAEISMRVLGDKCVRIRPTRGKDATEHLIAGGTLEEIGIV